MQVLFWMKENLQKQLWRLGTQPIMLLLAYGSWKSLPATWNLDGLGYKTDIAVEVLNSAAILHWSGASKPWLPREFTVVDKTAYVGDGGPVWLTGSVAFFSPFFP